MSFSRMPESRGGGNLRLFGLVIVAIVVAAALVFYFAVGFGSNSSQAAPPDNTVNSNSPMRASYGVTGASLPAPQAVQQVPTPVANTAMNQKQSSGLQSAPIPTVKYGEVLSEGFITLDLPGNQTSEAWYTRQVDTYSKNLTLFFALYNDPGDTIIKTVEVAPYADGNQITNARLTMFYPNGAERYLSFDGAQGTISLTQRYGQPYGPSIFSPDLRIALVNYGVVLSDPADSIRADIHLDLSGLSDTESLTLVQTNPVLVNQVLTEVQGIVDQVNDKRPVQ